MAYNIYISFDSKDTDLARDLSKRLEKVGLRVANSTSKIDDPKNIKAGIEHLRKANEAIFLITPNSLNGKKILFDMGTATSLEKRLTCILVGVKPKELPNIVKGLDLIKYDELERYIGKLQRKVEETSKLPAKAQHKSGESSKSAA
jgi:hypothetical protein